MGTRPAAGYWVPGGRAAPGEIEPVPQRFRNLRIRRTRKRRPEKPPFGIIMPILLFVIFTAVMLAWFLMGGLQDLWPTPGSWAP